MQDDETIIGWKGIQDERERIGGKVIPTSSDGAEAMIS
jgi:hypothetical protein